MSDRDLSILVEYGRRQAEALEGIERAVRSYLNLIDPKGGDTCRKENRATAATQPTKDDARGPISSPTAMESDATPASAGSTSQSDSQPPTTPDVVATWREWRGTRTGSCHRDGQILAAGDALVAEVERLRENNRVLRCAFCGKAYPPGTPATQHERLTAHVAVCPKHPMRAAESRASDLEQQLREAVELLREAKPLIGWTAHAPLLHGKVDKFLDEQARRASPTPKGRNE